MKHPVTERHLAAVPTDMTGGVYAMPGIVASSAPIKKAIERATALRGGQSAGVLICGEPGTGRRSLARAIHSMHASPTARLTELDCGAQGGNNLEETLFGAASSEARAFGSVNAPVESVTASSLVYQALGGTLLLLNLPDMSSRAQGRLARLLRDGEADLAGAETITADIRAIACVEPGFDVLLAEGRLRADLLKRLAENRIDLPPLRERREDIPALVNHFLDTISASLQLPRKSVSHPSMTLLTSLPYHGNARELGELVRALVESVESRVIRLEDVLRILRLDVRAPGAVLGRPRTLRDARVQFERQYIREVLDRHNGSIADAARSLGIQRTNLYRKMRTLGVGHVMRKGANGSRKDIG